ncbi:MBL fold metallo-hydrolase [Ekhidna sp.]|uniref:MBL fold metallo-hydrolase n=1 Tax=Ekhidna sp. TaxID=2608089 RepID=UPI0032EEED2F
MQNQVFLKQNVVIEPMVNNWYAWTHLIYPPTLAMEIANRQLKIIESYIEEPEVHRRALKLPSMRGGPFMDFGGEDRSADVNRLKESTLGLDKLLELSNAIHDLDEMLTENTDGHSLQEVYEKVPDPLKGFVELYYDRRNNPGFRFFEPLWYKSEYYNKNLQSIAVWLTENDERPFCLSTPFVGETDKLHLPISFDHEGIDRLSRMRRTADSYHQIAQLLGITPEQEPHFRTLFTTEAPPPYKEYHGDKIRMRYFGHACILLETSEVSILVDPLVSYYGYQTDLEHFSDADLPEFIDYVLITHNHQDHILFETLLPLRHRIKNIIVPGSRSGRLEDVDMKLLLNTIGFKNVTSILEMESIRFSDVEITSLPFTGEHCDLNIMSKSCYTISISDFKLLFTADSRIIEPRLYEHVSKQIGVVDVIFMGMECDGAPLSWLYGPLFSKEVSHSQDQSRRLSGSNCQEGMQLIDIFKPSEVYVYAMGQEPWVEFISSIKYTDESNPIVQSNKLVEKCKASGIMAERLFGEKEILYNKKDMMILD